MPRDRNNYGSSAYTREKLAQFGGICSMLGHICAGKTWCKRYLYIDMNAGPGVVPDLGIAGSPLVFLDVARACNLPYQAVLIEKNDDSANALRAACGGDPWVTVFGGDHCTIMPDVVRSLPILPRGIPGLIYHDPNGVPSFAALAEVSRMPQAKMLDIVIRVAATGIKRANGWHRKRDRPYQTLMAGLKSIEKARWIVREPAGQWAWTFLIGSNWKQFPDWRKRGFYALDSERGRDIIAKISYPEQEQPAVFGQQSLPLIPRIPATPDVPSDTGGSDSGGERRLSAVPPPPGH